VSLAGSVSICETFEVSGKDVGKTIASAMSGGSAPAIQVLQRFPCNSVTVHELAPRVTLVINDEGAGGN